MAKRLAKDATVELDETVVTVETPAEQEADEKVIEEPTEDKLEDEPNGDVTEPENNPDETPESPIEEEGPKPEKMEEETEKVEIKTPGASRKDGEKKIKVTQNPFIQKPKFYMPNNGSSRWNGLEFYGY